MLYRNIFRILGYYFCVFTALLLIPLGVAAYFEWTSTPLTHPQAHSTLYFFKTIIIGALIGLAFIFLGKESSGAIYRKESLVIVVMIWFLTPVLAGLPFYLSDTLNNPLQAYFEAVSGLTTTGATAMQAKKYDPFTGEEIPIKKQFCGITNSEYSFYGTIEPIRNPVNNAILYEGIEAVGAALLFWRSMTQWLGGGGIIVLFVAVLPALGVGGKFLFHSEMTGPVKDTFTPRIKETAIALWKVYVGLTVLHIITLMATNHEMPFFDALTIAFSTLSTGGFSIHNASIGAYHNATTDWVIIVFMILGSINFAYYYYAAQGKFFRIYEPELLLFLIIILVVGGLATFFIVGTDNILLDGTNVGPYNLSDGIRYAFFQTVSSQTSTGFTTTRFDLWPDDAQSLLLIIMYIGGMAGSTAGGIKVIRHYMLFRIAQFRIEALFRPFGVRNLYIGYHLINENTALRVLTFFLIVIATSVASTFIYIMDDIDPETALGVTACMVNNTGIAFRMAGPADSFAFLSNFSLALSSFLMLLGRLEFLAVLALLVPAFWKKNA